VEVAWLAGATMTVTGNSFAAPVVAGHVARILGAHPEFSVWQVRTVLAALAANAG
jgi:subtilisin family serine protease